MTFHTWSLYLIAAMALSLAPGPNGLLALSNGTLYGVRKAASATLGGALGFTLLIAVSATGVGALLQASTYLLVTMKWLGGAYLVWLGIQVWRAPSPVSMLREDAPARPAAVLFRQGFLAAVSNPKAILFFGAFLMQFVDPTRSIFMQFAIMAATFVLVEFITEIAIAALAQRIQGWLKRSGKRFNQVCGCLFMLIGAYLPWSR